MARRLIAPVCVGDTAYRAGSVPPPEVAALITNPAAWADDEPEAAPSVAGESNVFINCRAEAAPSVEPVVGDKSNDERSELEAMPRADLVALAKARGVDARGSAADLVDRLSQG